MCNPRRVEVTAATHLNEAWEHEVQRVSRLTATATGVARVRERLDSSIGAPTLAALARVLRQAEGWRLEDDHYVHDLDDGYIAYHPATQELEIVARATGEAHGEGTAAVRVSGVVDEEIRAAGVGRYYDDEYGGVTEQDAQRAADADAQRNLETRGRERIDEERRIAEAAHDAELSRIAEARASDDLAAQLARRTGALDADAEQRLAGLGIQARNIFYRLLAEAIREAFLAYARARGATRIEHTEVDGVLEIEFDLAV